VPVVHGSVAGFVGQVSTIFPDDRGYEAIYGTEEGLPERGVEVTLGNLSGIVGTVSAIQSVEAVKVLCGVGESLRGRLLFIDLENMTFEIFRL
jgi:molybdopterin/thiamine biosynthesis adenylyltransferase